MTTYFYAPVVYDRLKEFITTLGAKRLIRFDGMRFLNKGRPVEFNKNDIIICWGYHVPTVPNVRMLNSNSMYPNQVLLNIDLHTRVTRQDYVVGYELIMYKNLVAYNQALFEQRNSTKNVKIVAYKDVPGYGMRRFDINNDYKVHIFLGKLINVIDNIPDNVVKEAISVLNNLHMDFGVVYVSKINSTYVIRKVMTAPKFTDVTFNLYQHYLRDWIYHPSIVSPVMPTI